MLQLDWEFCSFRQIDEQRKTVCFLSLPEFTSMKPHFQIIVSSLFLLLSLYNSSTSLVERCCLGYVNSGSDTSDACIEFPGLVSNRSHSHVSCFPGRQPIAPQPLQSFLFWTIPILLPPKNITPTKTHILSQATASETQNIHHQRDGVHSLLPAR